jgi:isocitrate lyase
MTAKVRSIEQLFQKLPKDRFKGVQRPYSVEDVERLRGTLQVHYTLSEHTSNKLWTYLNEKSFVPALGCLTGNQAMQCAKAGLDAIYLSGWQVAADANGDMYPDQSLYSADSGPALAKRINNALRRADLVERSEGSMSTDYYKPIVADCEAGFGGALNCFELTKNYIEAGVAGVHFEDQLGAEKKCGHMGGKVLIPTRQHVKHLNAARLAADVCGVPLVIIARTDAESARLLTSDIDERDHEFIDNAAGRTVEGFFRLKDDGLNHSIKRAIAFAPYSDLIWMETSVPDLQQAKAFAEGVKKVFPDKMLAYNCSPSFNWRAKLNPTLLPQFQKELGAMGFKFQFVTLAGFHANNYGMFELARNYKTSGMEAYSHLQEKEFEAEKHGYTAVKHQREVGAGYFDKVATTAAGGEVSTQALEGSTEQAQFYAKTVDDALSGKAPPPPPTAEVPRRQMRAYSTHAGEQHAAVKTPLYKHLFIEYFASKEPRLAPGAALVDDLSQ